jgi:predicted transcriptional regulator
LAQKAPDPLLSYPKITSQDTFECEYQLHAYQDGNFKELKLSRRMTWLDILQVLYSVFKNPTPEEYFAIRINDYLNETGLKDAQLQMLRAHAVARSQINFRVLQNIKQQLRQSDWVVPVGRDDRQRTLWKFTEKGLNLLDKMTANKASL